MTKREIESVLTNYGTLLGPKKFDIIKDRAVIKKYIQFNDMTISYPQYKKVSVESKDYYRVPRNLIPIKECIRDRVPKTIKRTTINLHDYQEIVVDTVCRDIKKGGHTFLLQMDTGLGKSFVAAGIINKLRLRTCMVVSNKLLMVQMQEDIEKAFGGEITVSRSKNDFENDDVDVNIVCINTGAKLPKSFWEQFGLVILDEVHGYCSDTFMEIFWKADFSQYIFGMTATPTRIDNMQSVLLMHLGPVIKAETIYGQLESCKPGNFHGHVVRVNYYGPEEYTQTITNKNGMMSTVLMAKQFLEDEYRMAMAARIVSELYDLGRNIYVFCQTKSPLKVLRRRIVKMTGRDRAYRKKLKDDIHVVTGDSTQDETKDARSNARVFLTTYALSSKGLSLPRFD